MIQLSDEQLHNLGKEALIIIVSSLQDQLHSLQSQLDLPMHSFLIRIVRSNFSQNRSSL